MPAFTGPSWSLPGALAGADLSAAGNMYRFVKYSGANLIRASVLGERVAGVLYNDPKNTEAADLKFSGCVTVEAGEALATPGTAITTDNQGRAVAVTTTAQLVHGYTVTTSAGAGEYVAIVLRANEAGTSAAAVYVSGDIADGSLDTSYFLVSPVAGTITKIYTVIDGVVSTADITITAKIATVAVTNGVVTIPTAASAAGNVASATPTAANVVAAGGAVELVVAGGGAGGSPRIHLVMEITR